MLKEVMLGSGGIMLAAAIFASSVAPEIEPAAGAPAIAPEVATSPAVAPPIKAAAPRPVQVFGDTSGDMSFGAPMIETTPVESGMGEDGPISAAPESAEASGGRQFYSIPGRPNPIPR